MYTRQKTGVSPELVNFLLSSCEWAGFLHSPPRGNGSVFYMWRFTKPKVARLRLAMFRAINRWCRVSPVGTWPTRSECP